MFKNIPNFPGDPILGLAEQFKKDPREGKVNLSVGLYHDEEGIVPQLEPIRRARDMYFENETKASTYLPMGGYLPYRKEVEKLLFGEDAQSVKEGNIATIQSLGGSGALSIGGMFLKKFYPESKVYVSNPTWGNHISIFEAAGFKVEKYPYYDAATHGVDFNRMLEFIRQLTPKSIVLLHPCCHNPTGADLTEAQWDALIPVLKDHDLIPFLDIAYMGMGNGFEEDTYAIRAMEKSGLYFVVSHSFSKIFSLYGERIGALCVVCEDQEAAVAVESQLCGTVRKVYSNPPSFGAHLVYNVLSSPELKALWIEEVKGMRKRIKDMRQALADELKLQGQQPEEYEFYLKQKGMFSFTGFSKEQAVALREEEAIYIIENGRMCIAGLTSGNVKKVADAFAKIELAGENA